LHRFAEAIFQHAFHELYRRTPALLTELRRYGLFRRQVLAANEAAELQRLRADRAIAVNTEVGRRCTLTPPRP
jgi:hypothetical protein